MSLLILAFTAFAQTELFYLDHRTTDVFLVLENAAAADASTRLRSAFVAHRVPRGHANRGERMSFSGSIVSSVQVGHIQRSGTAEPEPILYITFVGEVREVIEAVAYYPKSRRMQAFTDQKDAFVFPGSSLGNREVTPWSFEHLDQDVRDGLARGMAAPTYVTGDMQSPSREDAYQRWQMDEFARQRRPSRACGEDLRKRLR